MRKFLIPGALILLIALSFIAIFDLVPLGFQTERKSVFSAVPADAAFIIKYNNTPKTLEKFEALPYWKVMKHIDLVHKVNEGFDLLDTLLANNDQQQIYTQAQVLFSAHLIKATDFDFLHLISPKQTIDLEEMIQLAGFSAEKRTYEQIEIFDIPIDDNGATYTCAYPNGIFMGSLTPFLVEAAILNMNSEKSLINDPDFQQVNKLAGDHFDATIFINFTYLSRFSSIYVSQPGNPFFQLIKELKGWAELDIVLDKQGVVFNGYSLSSPYLQQFNYPVPKESRIFSVLPYNTAFFHYTGIHDSVNFFERSIPSAELEDQLIEKHLLPWIDNEWAYVITEPYDTSYASEQFALVKCQDSVQARIALSSLKDPFFEPQTYRNIEIRKLKELPKASIVFGRFFRNLKSPYYVVLEDYVLFANSLANLKIYIELVLGQQTLHKDIKYLAFSENLASASNLYFYFNTPRMLQVLKANASAGFRDALATNFNHYKKLNPIAFQFSGYKNLFYTNGYVNFSSKVENRTALLWKTTLDTTLLLRPQIVTNHRNMQHEILVQDASHNLYLISKSGDILWKRKVDGPIMGKVYQMDYYKNNKLQYLFNTPKRVHLVDRNGRNVAHFPIKLPAEASAGLALFDYDKRKKYRFFVPTVNRQLYGYEWSGKPLPGWSPKKNMGLIRFPLQHVAVKGKDYILAVNESGKIFIFNRRGDLRGDPIKLSVPLNNPFHFDPGRNLFISTDTTGGLIELSVDGKINQSVLGSYPNGHYFETADVAGDPAFEYIFIEENRMHITSQDGNRLSSYTFPGNIDLPICLNEIPGNSKTAVGVVQRSSANLFLFDAGGNLYPDFPLEGTTPFVVHNLYKDNRSILIVGNRHQVYAYRLR